MGLIKIGDAAVSEQKVVDTTTMSSNNPEGQVGLNLFVKKKTKKPVFLKKIFILYLLNVKPLEILDFLQEQWQISD